MKLVHVDNSTDPLEASMRAFNVMKANGIDTIGKLAHIPDADLRRLQNCGKKTVKELRDLVPYQPDRIDFVYVDDYYDFDWLSDAARRP